LKVLDAHQTLGVQLAPDSVALCVLPWHCMLTAFFSMLWLWQLHCALHRCIFHHAVALATVFHTAALPTAFVILLLAMAFRLTPSEFLWQHFLPKKEK